MLTILTVSIAACNSTSHHQVNTPTPIPTSTEQERLAAIEANRVALLAKAKAAGLTEAQAADYAAANKEASATVAQTALNKLVAEKLAAEKAAAEKAAAEKAAAIEANRVALLAKAKEAGLTEAQATDYAAANKEADAATAQTALDNLVAAKLAAEKAEAERLAAEKAEQERLAAIEANRVALLAKAKEAGLTEAQAIDYAAANKEADAATAQTALDNLVAAKLAAEKAEAERLAAEKAEQERLAAIEANRVALLAKAKEAGLTEAQATDYAAANKEASVEAAQTALDGIVAENKRIADKKLELFAKAQTAGLDATRAQTFADNNVNTADDAVAGALTADVAKAVTADKGGTYTGSGLTNDTKVTSQSSGYGQITTPYGTTYTSYTKTEKSVNKTYNQPYSVVVGKGTVSTTTDNYSSYNSSSTSTFKIDKVAGLATLEENLPKTGKAVYLGEAFGEFDKTGKLTYAIDFDKRKGSGNITGLDFGVGSDKFELKEGELTKITINNQPVIGITGSTSGSSYVPEMNGPQLKEFSKGAYTLGLYGPKAEEIAGSANIYSDYTKKDYLIGFGGQKDAKATLKQVAIDAGLTATRAQAYADAYVDKADAADALKTAVQTQADDQAKLLAQGTAIGLTDAHAQTYATKNLDTAQDQLKTALETEAKAQALELKQALATQSGLDNSYANAPVQNYKYIDENTTNSQGQVTVRKGYQSIYSQPYSMVVSTSINKYIKDDIDQLSTGQTSTNLTGFATQAKFIPVEGKASYMGKAIVGDWTIFNMDLVYNVDFGKRAGSGYLTKGYADNNYGSKITLNEGSIDKVNIKGNDVVGISSTAKSLNNLNGTYAIGFYGTEAQEIAGTLNMPQYSGATKNSEFGLGATRGDITK